MEPFTF